MNGALLSHAPRAIRLQVAACVALALAACSASPQTRSSPSAEAAPAILSVVGTNDLHGGVLPRDGVGGLALLSGYVEALRAARARDGGAVLLIDAGDMFQGTLESNLGEGAPVVAAYNALGYTAAAVGNHEFDFGPVGLASVPVGPYDDPRGALKARAAEARFPFLAANLIDESTGRPVEWPNVRPTATIDAAGVRIGIIGVMTSQALSATTSSNVVGLRIAPLSSTIVEHAERLRRDGAAIVIVSAHAGGRCKSFDDPADLSSCNPAGEIMGVAGELRPGLVDVIVAGHSHAGMAHVVNGIPIIESFAGGRAFGRVDLIVERPGGRVLDRRIFPPRDLCAREGTQAGVCLPETSTAPAGGLPRYEGAVVSADTTIQAVLAPAVEKAEAVKSRPLGVAAVTPVRRGGAVESPLGNLFADALLSGIAGADAALYNTTGGLRADLPAGPLLYGHVYEMMPFDDRLVPIRLTGAELRAVLARQLQRTSRILGVAGVRVRAGCEQGAVAVDLLRPSGTPVQDHEFLTVVASDFLATGGDNILTPVIPPGGFPVPEDAPLARDVFAGHLRERGRDLREEELVDLRNPRTSFPGSLPLACN